MILTVIVQVLLIFRLRSRGRSSFDWSVSIILAGDFIGIIDWSWARRRFSWILNYWLVQGQIEVKLRWNWEVQSRSDTEMGSKLTLSQTGAEFVRSSNCLQARVVNWLDLNWLKMMKYGKHATSIHWNILSTFVNIFQELSAICQIFVSILLAIDNILPTFVHMI